jgi:hypothetical protein
MRKEPLLLHFAQPIPEPKPQLARYDTVRQLSEVNQEGSWTPSWQNSDALWRGTKTAVATEPTE